MKEEWKEIKDNKNYLVSNTGKIYNKENGYELKPWIINSGYKQLTVSTGNGLVHRIVAKTFIPNEDISKDIVNHIDNDKLNNHVDNLEWVDYKGNTAHAGKQGRLDTHTARAQLKKVSSKEVYQKDMKGNTIKKWSSPNEAEKETEGYFSASKISSVAHGSRKHHRNFKWEYVDKESTRSHRNSINMYNLDNEIIQEDMSMRNIMDFLGMNNHKTLRDKLRKTDDFVEYKGYKFKNNK